MRNRCGDTCDCSFARQRRVPIQIVRPVVRTRSPAPRDSLEVYDRDRPRPVPGSPGRDSSGIEYRCQHWARSGGRLYVGEPHRQASGVGDSGGVARQVHGTTQAPTTWDHLGPVTTGQGP
jgi:hypothetical protein